jgi:predicted TIM-barrel fold metal-dependent hydrolase
MPLTLTALLVSLTSALGQTAPLYEDMPKIDIHAHYFDDMPAFVEMLEQSNMKVVNICVFKNRPHMIELLHDRATALTKKYSPTMKFTCTFDLTRINDPDFVRLTTQWMDKQFDAGALMMKIWKEVGMEARMADGTLLMPDSELLDPIYAHLEKRGKPLIAHIGDPLEAWQPLDEKNIHAGYFTNHPEWHMYGKEGYPSHEELMEAYERMLAKHSNLTVIGAHLGSLSHDLDALGRRFERFPNFYVDVGARTGNLKWTDAQKVRAFFIKYQDRILYGLDQGAFSEGAPPSLEKQRTYSNAIDAAYRRDYEYYAGAKLDLPREVLEKFYYKNAEKILGKLE